MVPVLEPPPVLALLWKTGPILRAPGACLLKEEEAVGQVAAVEAFEPVALEVAEDGHFLETLAAFLLAALEVVVLKWALMAMHLIGL
jgi:hypothetical protein